jgi:ABC-2 type transport system ATP-binding protein
VKEAAIQIRGLVHRFKDKEALRGVDLEVAGPGVYGFIGVNGAGKTTTMRILNGFLKPTAGEVRIFGVPVGPEHSALRARVGYLPQVPAFHGWMTGEEVLAFTADLYGIERRRARVRTERLLQKLGLSDAARRRVRGYSGGMRQRLGIAAALVSEPELLLLDEPVSSLDPVGRAEMLGLVASLGRSSTVFMSSHILADAERVCDHVAILHEGRIVAAEPTEELRERYVRKVYEVDFEGDGTSVRSQLRDADWCAGVDEVGKPEEGARLRVRVRVLEQAGRELPLLLGRSGVFVSRLELVTPTLEQVFLEIVGRTGEGSKEAAPEREAPP